jgi:hypothetical protein
MAESYPPMTSWKSALKGFVAGSLFVLSALNAWGFPFQALLFVVAFLVMIDSLVPYGAQPYIVTSVVAIFAGGIVSLIASITGNGIAYLVIIFIIGVIIYIDRLYHYLKRRSMHIPAKSEKELAEGEPKEEAPKEEEAVSRA